MREPKNFQKNFFRFEELALNNVRPTGGYVTVSTTGSVTLIAPFSGTVGLNQYFQPGQGFFVKTSGASPALTIRERDKAATVNAMAFRVGNAGEQPSGSTGANQVPLIAINLLFKQPGGEVLADGVLSAFDDSFSNDITTEDASKPATGAETISIQRGADLLSIDARRMPISPDTIFLNLSKLTKPGYTLQVFSSQLSGRSLLPFLEDGWLHTAQPLSLEDTNRVDFNVDISQPGSLDPSRFRIVFRVEKILPVALLSFQATVKEQTVTLHWRAVTGNVVMKYVIERSGNGINFFPVGEVYPKNTVGVQEYQWMDEQLDQGQYFYRVRTVQLDGRSAQSQMLTITLTSLTPDIEVFPIPVRDNNIMLHFKQTRNGRYTLQLFDARGVLIARDRLEYSRATSINRMNLEQKLKSGIYHLLVISNGIQYRKKILVQ